jgi:hypothetical protein
MWLRVLGGFAVVALSFWLTLVLLDYRDHESDSTSLPTGPKITAVDTRASKADLGWPGCTLRVVIPHTAVIATGRGVSVKFGAGASRGLNIVEAFIGYSSREGPPYAFDGPPAQLYFDAKADVSIAKAASRSSDDVRNFKLVKERNIVVAFYVSDKLNDDPVAKEPTSGWHTFFKCSQDTNTVRAINYQDRSGKFVSHGIMGIDIRAEKK